MSTSIAEPRFGNADLPLTGARYGYVGAPVLAGLIVLAIGLLTTSAFPVGVFYDDGQYVILAKALATGEGYRFINIPGHPAATHFPPGYPAFLAALWWLWPSFPDNVVLFRVANAVLFAAGAAGWTWLAIHRLRLEERVALAAVVGFALAIPVVLTTNVLFSERLFFALLCPAIVLAERSVEEREGPRWTPLAAGVLCGLLVLVRTIGVASGATLLLLLARRRWRASALFAAGFSACVLPWLLWASAHADEVSPAIAASYGPYGALVADTYRSHGAAFFADVLAKNLAGLIRPLPAFFSPVNWQPVRLLVLVPVLGALAVGVRGARRSHPALLAFLAGYFAIVLVWPFAPDRFVWVVWPLLGALIAAGIVEILAWRPAQQAARGLRAALVAGFVVALVGYLRYNGYGYAKGWYDSPQRDAAQSIAAVVRWVNEHTKPGDVVATDADPLVHLYTGRETVPNVGWSLADYLSERPVDTLRAETRSIIDRYRATHVIVSRNDAPAALGIEAMMNARPAELTLIAILPGTGAVFVPAKK